MIQKGVHEMLQNVKSTRSGYVINGNKGFRLFCSLKIWQNLWTATLLVKGDEKILSRKKLAS